MIVRIVHRARATNLSKFIYTSTILKKNKFSEVDLSRVARGPRNSPVILAVARCKRASVHGVMSAQINKHF